LRRHLHRHQHRRHRDELPRHRCGHECAGLLLSNPAGAVEENVQNEMETFSLRNRMASFRRERSHSGLVSWEAAKKFVFWCSRGSASRGFLRESVPPRLAEARLPHNSVLVSPEVLSMKRFARSLSALAALWLLVAPARALTTNNWQNFSSGPLAKWERNGNWTAGVPSSNDAVNVINNGLTKSITVDAVTVLSNNIPGNGCMTISNLILGAA